MLTKSFSNSHRLVLIAGDLIVFFLFAAIGRRAHSMGSALDDVTGTALPFILGWFIVAPFTGAFKPAATDGVGNAAKTAALTWLVAFPLGHLIRTPIVGRWAHISFAIVAGIFTFIVLIGWRTVYARFAATRG
jgi:hypothetical protein